MVLLSKLQIASSAECFQITHYFIIVLIMVGAAIPGIRDVSYAFF